MQLTVIVHSFVGACLSLVFRIVQIERALNEMREELFL